MLSVSPPSHWMQSLGLLGGLVGAAWMALRLERDERDAVLVDRKALERARTELRKRMDPKPEWMRRLRKKWMATGRLGSQKLNGKSQ